MAATRVYSTAAYWVAGGGALLLSLCPKFGAAVASIPWGVLGGATVLLYGMIGILGVRIWVENRVDFSKSLNITTAAIPLVIGIANYSFSIVGAEFGGIAIGSVAAIVIYHVLALLMKARGFKDFK
jgi:xanthine/uracil permease